MRLAVTILLDAQRRPKLLFGPEIPFGEQRARFLGLKQGLEPGSEALFFQEPKRIFGPPKPAAKPASSKA